MIERQFKQLQDVYLSNRSSVKDAVMAKYSVPKLAYPAEKHNLENVMDVMVIMGIVLVLMETIMVCTGM